MAAAKYSTKANEWNTSSYIVFEIIPPVLREHRHDINRQNVPIKNATLINRKKSSADDALLLDVYVLVM